MSQRLFTTLCGARRPAFTLAFWLAAQGRCPPAGDRPQLGDAAMPPPDRKSLVHKRMFMTGDAQPGCHGWFGHAEAPPCQVFKEQQAQAPSLAAIGERISAAQKKVDELRRVIQAGKK